VSTNTITTLFPISSRKRKSPPIRRKRTRKRKRKIKNWRKYRRRNRNNRK
jgi:hypothetical protein